MTILHLFDQPLAISDQYEGYIGNLVVPRKVVDQAAEGSILIDFFTPPAPGDAGHSKNLSRHPARTIFMYGP